MRSRSWGSRIGAALLLLLILTTFNVTAQTTVFFDTTQVFGIQPPYNTNRVFKIQSLSPFAGNFFWRTSDVSGQFYVSNALATTYSGQMLAPPNGLTFSFYVSATNLGVIPAQGITSIPANGAQTFPAGQTAYSAQASDNRYAPIGSGPFSALTAAQSTNLVQGATNALLMSLTNSIDVGTLHADNVILPFGNAITKANSSSNLIAAVPGVDYDVGATNGMTTIVYSNSAVFADTNLVYVTSNSLAGQIGSAGISALTATNISSNQVWSATNMLSSLATSNAATVLYTNALPALTNNFVTAAVTNGLAGVGITNGFVDSRITNSAATIAFAESLTNGFVDKSITNNAATIQFAVNLTNNIRQDVIGTVGVDNGDGIFVGIGTPSNWRQLAFDSEESALGFGAIAQGGSYVGVNLNLSTNTFGYAEGGASANGYLGGMSNSYVFAEGGSWSGVHASQGSGVLTISEEGSMAGLESLSATNSEIHAQEGGVAVGQFANSSLINLTVDGGFGYLISKGKSNITVNLNRSLVLASPSNNYSATVSDTIGIIDGAGHFIGFNTNNFFGDASGLTNIPVAGISTNGSAANQVITSIGGKSVWTNANSVVVASITNAVGTNFPNGLFSNQFLYYPTNDPTISSNWFQFSKVSSTNGYSTGQQATNFTILGNVAFGTTGQATNIDDGNRTNYIYFAGAGTSLTTNGALLWSTALGLYTNWGNGSVLTNNGTAWLYQTNGVTLYSIAGSNPYGAYSAVSGSAPAPAGLPTVALNDHFIFKGFWSVSNQMQISNSIIVNASNNAIANFNGNGTNTFLQDPNIQALRLNFGASNSVGAEVYIANLSGGSNSLVAGRGDLIAGGFGNAIFNPSTVPTYTTIGAGISNKNGSSFGFVGGGVFNTISNLSPSSVVVGGNNNMIRGPTSGTLTSEGSFIGGGEYNAILGINSTTAGAFGSVIPGGQSNTIYRSYGTALGHNVIITNDNSFAWSDGTPLTTTTNSQFVVQGTNGIYSKGPMWLDSLSTNGGIYFKSNQFSLFAVTNGIPNFTHWTGVSNNSLVHIYYSNGVVYMTAFP